MTKPVLLFDLGGVIVPWVGFDALAEDNNMTREAVIARLAKSDIFNAYEIGECDDLTFLKEMVSLFEMDIAPQAFADIWNSWVLPPFPNTLQTLKSLKDNYIVACLSNTNALHWQHLNGMLDLNAVFDFAFASQQIKTAKPHPRSYQIPIEDMGVDPADVIFFDDTLPNVEAARAEGITTHHVDRHVGVIPTLKTLGII